MISVKDQQNLLIEIGKRIPYEITVYAIGGTAMMFLGLKEATLDVDLVFTKTEDKKAFKKAAKELGYKEMDSTIVHGVKDNSPEMISLGDARLDLFSTNVIDFIFSVSMQKRSRQDHQFGKNLLLKIADVHDIILMKCATRRVKDEDDIINLIRSIDTINWSLLVEEARNQVALGKETAIFNLGTLLETLKHKHKVKVPNAILGELWKLVKKQADKKSRSENAMTKKFSMQK
ncbi:MAG TPA: hypothetical protein HA282_02095 [Nanoarchaeota archaeon]|nr:MAG: hypothetical protein QT01_C0002G0077 [archaeon GW2011_AR6]MBS3082669.1 hypothetical protein [Candidatus Pacearchaeota archaeon]HIH18229.1 hypothetical protein [Nanoarchaeota archaeon]HIH34243.1 hypothetical protein [Nanoarchaeota archaeon]HIH50899.1 hypothetical protein [Nanoarchaeota archaeon]